jgi:hypothetical protein
LKGRHGMAVAGPRVGAMADQCLGTIATRTVAGLLKEIHSAVIPVHPYRVLPGQNGPGFRF